MNIEFNMHKSQNTATNRQAQPSTNPRRIGALRFIYGLLCGLNGYKSTL